MNVISEFERLAREATIEVDETGNVSCIVPYCSEMLGLINNHVKMRPEFFESIKRLWHSKKIEGGVIELCCHVLQWQELKDYFVIAFNEAKKTESWNDWQKLSHVVQAIEQDWEDAKDFYASYFNN
jgi:hypothetical protein